MQRLHRKSRSIQSKNKNLSNYLGPDHSIYQALILLSNATSFLVIAYLNLQS